MRISRLGVTLGFMMLVFSNLASARCCQCEARDGSCSASICCTGGCLAICVPKDNCTTDCASLLTEGSAVGIDRAVTIQEEIGGLAKVLAQETGVSISIKPKPGSGALQINASEFPVRRLLEVLSRYADVTVDGKPLRPELERQGLALDELVFLEFVDSDQESVSSALTRVLHVPVEFSPKEDGATVSMEMKDVTLRQALKALARIGAIRISGEPYRPEQQ